MSRYHHPVYQGSKLIRAYNSATEAEKKAAEFSKKHNSAFDSTGVPELGGWGSSRKEADNNMLRYNYGDDAKAIKEHKQKYWGDGKGNPNGDTK